MLLYKLKIIILTFNDKYTNFLIKSDNDIIKPSSSIEDIDDPI